MLNKIITSAEELDNLPPYSIVAFTDDVERFEHRPEMQPNVVSATKLDDVWYFTADPRPGSSHEVDFTECTGILLWPLPIEGNE